jgi:hypothetical protein
LSDIPLFDCQNNLMPETHCSREMHQGNVMLTALQQIHQTLAIAPPAIQQKDRFLPTNKCYSEASSFLFRVFSIQNVPKLLYDMRARCGEFCVSSLNGLVQRQFQGSHFKLQGHLGCVLVL